MKTLISNFQAVFRRYKVATCLNIVGLSAAFTAFIVLMMQVSFDWGYDRFHTNADRIFRAEIQMPDGNVQPVFPRPLVEQFFASSPHIQAAAIAKKWDNERNVAVEQDGKRTGFQELYYHVSEKYPEVFDFRIIEGDPYTLTHPEKVLIPESMARRFFPYTSAVGKQLDGEELKAEIGGVYRDFPDNSMVDNAIYQRIPDNEGAGNWQHHNYEGYVLLDDAKNKETVLENFAVNFWSSLDYKMKQNKVGLTHLPDVYYQTNVTFDSQKVKGSRLQVFVLFCIAFIIVGIAAVNFTNFSNALVPVRLKSINTQKVLGCPVRKLRVSMLIEAVGICLLSFGLALVVVRLLSDTSFSGTISGGIRLATHSQVLIATGILALLTGLLAGFWPAWYITSFPPAVVLKGNFGLSPKGRGVRNLLVGMQFVATFTLIVVAIFITLQNKYMTQASPGFEKEQIAIIKLNKKLGRNPELLRQRLLSISEIEEVATADRIIGGGDAYSTMGREYEGKQVMYQLITVDPTILKVLGIGVTEGREFVAEDMGGYGALIFNETAQKEFELEVGKTMNLDWEEYHFREPIIGFMDDLKYNSYRADLRPFAFYVNKYGSRNYALVRLHAGTNYTVLKESVNKVLIDLDPDYPLDISLYNNVLENLYKKELLLGAQIFFFSLIAIFISLVGVFGIVLFESEYKRREIGVRKVFGSTIEEILLLLGNHYVRILVICFILAAPLAYIAVNNWLQNFSYKTPVYGWVFVFSFVIVTLLTLLTVTIQNWRVARSNPVESLRSE